MREDSKQRLITDAARGKNNQRKNKVNFYGWHRGDQSSSVQEDLYGTKGLEENTRTCGFIE